MAARALLDVSSGPSAEAGAGDKSARQTLTIVIPTKDAAVPLRTCLASVSWADEIIVVDMYSTDNTAAVCAAHPQCRLLQRNGYIEENLNYGLDQAIGDWVMRLDSDEEVTPELATEIRELLADPPDGVTGFAFWERPIILGRELTHGWARKHHRKMLFRRGAARHGARGYHDDYESDGVWVQGTHGYLHRNYATISDFLRKIDFYTTGDVERVDPLPARRPSLHEGLFAAARSFYLNYVKRRGFLDGWIGLVDAGMRSFYQFAYWAKLRERWESEHI